jgi:hypothetical protein
MFTKRSSLRLLTILPTSGTAVFNINRTFCDSNNVISKDINISPKITIYQYKICPFCNRVKSYLDYLNLGNIIINFK